MAKRDVIKIDEDKCNGCGQCVPNCPEGAIQIIQGKARLISDLFCDGLGACVGQCPQGAITIEQRQALAYDESQVMQNIVKQGKDVIVAHLNHLKEHGQSGYLQQALAILQHSGMEMTGWERKQQQPCACPGMAALDMRVSVDDRVSTADNPSRLAQWPIQLHLVNTGASYFHDADLLIAADCVPFSCANFHELLLKGKIVLIFCPKLDRSGDVYIEKLTEILTRNTIRSITLAHMEVPCCFGLVSITETALAHSGKTIPVQDVTISIKGLLQSSKSLK